VKHDERLTDTEFRSVTNYLEEMQDLHDFLSQHPFLLKNQSWYPIEINIYVADKAGLAEMAKELGTADKHESTYYFSLIKKFGQHKVEVNASRDKVCTKIKTGTKITKKHDPEAVSEALAQLPTIEVEEDVYEWQCPDSILKD